MIYIASSIEKEGTNLNGVVISLIVSLVSVLIALLEFMTIRPSIVTQADFDDLAV